MGDSPARDFDDTDLNAHVVTGGNDAITGNDAGQVESIPPPTERLAKHTRPQLLRRPCIWRTRMASPNSNARDRWWRSWRL